MIQLTEDDYRTVCGNVSQCQEQQSHSGLRSPVRSYSTYLQSRMLSDCHIPLELSYLLEIKSVLLQAD